MNTVILTLKPLVDTRLQEVRLSESDVVLGFYTSAGLVWLWIDLNAVRPSLLPWMEVPLALTARKSPLLLFLKAHFVGRVLRGVSQDAASGRVVRLEFGKPRGVLDSEAEPEAVSEAVFPAVSHWEEPSLEIRLFPHGRNVIARAYGKQVSWQKPRDLPEVPEDHDHAEFGERSSQLRNPSSRGLDQLREEWLASRKSPARMKARRVRAEADPKLRLQSELERRQKALTKVREELARKQELPWREVGDFLKRTQSLEIPTSWEPFVDRRRKLSWNIEQCYTKAREMDGKIKGTETRLRTLEKEVANLKAQLESLGLVAPAAASASTSASTLASTSASMLKDFAPSKPSPLARVEAQGRTLRLPGDMMAIMGKSAADNLKLLRQARAWDLWLHLRDHPSSHCILFRNKGAAVSERALLEVVGWYVRQQFGAKWDQQKGERVDVLIAECRHVRPIKGDKLGRVTYRDERVLTYRVPT
ncbi:MAG: hypothetical protein AB7P49_11185 [Bdellovibrionales bacterium]